ncbi:glycosyltransferase family 9 protein [archaeon]|nr:glycosyltransferase family 9 protein [archaeon]MBL7056792.1 glycosyltransferase family 9 protein [Candidatus Woesearchaeota archaeon]
MSSIKVLRTTDKYIIGPVSWIIGGLSKLFSKDKFDVKSIAFVKLWAIGDSVTSLPLIKAIKEKYPKSNITVIAHKRNFTVYEHQSFIDEIILFEEENLFKFLRKFDLVFDLEPYLNSSALLSWWIGKFRIGFSNQARSILYNKTSLFSKSKHMVEMYMDLGRQVGIEKTISKLEKLKVNKKEKEQVDIFLRKNGVKKNDKLAGICTGAAESVRERMWPKERFAELADYLTNKNYVVIFTGSPAESKLIEEVRSLMNTKSINSAGKISLTESFDLIEKCNIFISNDTGPMHVAAAQGCKTIGLFGPNTPVRWGPFGKGNVSIYHKISCSPCIINEKGIMPICINKEFQKCMKLISVKEVKKTINKLS